MKAMSRESENGEGGNLGRKRGRRPTACNYARYETIERPLRLRWRATFLSFPIVNNFQEEGNAAIFRDGKLTSLWIVRATTIQKRIVLAFIT